MTDAAQTRADKLALAGELAPRMRGIKVLRNIKVTDKDGNIVKVINSAELQEKLLERVGVEFDVADGVKPDFKQCRCGYFFRPKPRKGPSQSLCEHCLQPTCTQCKAPISLTTRDKAFRGQSKGICIKCFLKEKKYTPLLCSICGALCDEATSNEVRRRLKLGKNRKAYCDKHKRDVRQLAKLLPCRLCGEWATLRSSRNAHARRAKGKEAHAYCNQCTPPQSMRYRNNKVSLIPCSVCGAITSYAISKNVRYYRSKGINLNAYCDIHRKNNRGNAKKCPTPSASSNN